MKKYLGFEANIMKDFLSWGGGNSRLFLVYFHPLCHHNNNYSFNFNFHNKNGKRCAWNSNPGCRMVGAEKTMVLCHFAIEFSSGDTKRLIFQSQSRPIFVYFRPFLITISIIKIKKAEMVFLGFKPAATGW